VGEGVCVAGGEERGEGGFGEKEIEKEILRD